MTQISKKMFVKEWIKDLRSGKFKQKTGCLSDGKGKYCCLGVAQITAQRLGIVKDAFDGECDINDGSPKRQFWIKYFGTRNPEVSYKNAKTDLISMNDSLHCSFKTIADSLEKTFVQ